MISRRQQAPLSNLPGCLCQEMDIGWCGWVRTGNLLVGKAEAFFFIIFNFRRVGGGTGTSLDAVASACFSPWTEREHLGRGEGLSDFF